MNHTNYIALKNKLPTPGSNPNWEDFIDFFPSLNDLKTTPQDAFYHAEGDVWTHTKMVCDELINDQSYADSDDDSRFVMFYAALLHDISKPLCTKHEESGKITSAGHSKKGSVDTRVLLWKSDVPFDLRERICNVVATHQVPFFVFDDKSKNGKAPREPSFIAHSLSWQLNLNELIAVARSDMKGRFYQDKQKCLDDIELFEMLCKEENCFSIPKSFPSIATRMKYFNSNGAISPNYEFFENEGSNVTVMCGIPASGKNTWIENNISKEIPILSFDDAIEQMGLTHRDNLGIAIHHVNDNAKKLLAAKKDFVFNATHLSLQMRQKTTDLIQSYGGKVNIVYLEAPYEEIMKRNSKRDTTLNNETIEKMLYKWEVPTKMESHSILYVPNHGIVPKVKKRI